MGVEQFFFSDKVFSLLLKDCEIYENKEKINECQMGVKLNKQKKS